MTTLIRLSYLSFKNNLRVTYSEVLFCNFGDPPKRTRRRKLRQLIEPLALAGGWVGCLWLLSAFPLTPM